MAYNFAIKEPTLIVLVPGEFNSVRLSSIPLLKQILCSHRFRDDYVVETDVT